MSFKGTVPKTCQKEASTEGDKSLIKNGIWHFPRQMGDKKFKGFIYLIRDPYMERFYLGKKSYRSTRGRVKGNETNWKTYKSSSNSILEMLGERSLKDFEFYCIEEYTTLGGLSYAETWSLCNVNALTTNGWYNRRIERITWNVREDVTPFHKKRLSELTGVPL